MYSLGSDFSKFHRDYVKLSQGEINRLRSLKKLNLKRIEKGLEKYNEDQSKKLKIIDTREQGSVSMNTIIQAEENDYDIDVAIIFEEEDLNQNAKYAKHEIFKAIEGEFGVFQEPVKEKTNCITVKYQNGYHLDYAIYRKKTAIYKGMSATYEHSGENWATRDPSAITNWFQEANKVHEKQLRRIVQLLKSVCKKSAMELPGGLILSVIVNDVLRISTIGVDKANLDVTMYKIVKYLATNPFLSRTIQNPVHREQFLTHNEAEKNKVGNFYKLMREKYEAIKELEDTHYETKLHAIQCWGKFFEHPYWDSLLKKQKMSLDAFFQLPVRESFQLSQQVNGDIEESITTRFAISPTISTNNVKVDAKIMSKFGYLGSVYDYIELGERIPKDVSIDCEVCDTNLSKPYRVFWKVRNTGLEALHAGKLRGNIIEATGITEPTKFHGNHYIECYLVKNNHVCAIERIEILVE